MSRIISTQVNTKWAVEYGVDGALLLWWIYHWVNLNAANGVNFHDSKHWTYNSKGAMAQLFPFWTERQIARILQGLEDKGAIQSGNYNKSPYDRTKWFTIADTFCDNRPHQTVRSDLTESSDETSPNGETYTNINTSIDTTPIQASLAGSPPKKKEKPEWKQSFDEYLKLVEEAKEKILADPELQQKRILCDYPQLDVKKSLERSIRNYWGTEEAWNRKKKSLVQAINMVETLIKNIDKNRIYLPKDQQNEQEATTGTPTNQMLPVTVIINRVAKYFPDGIDYPYFPEQSDTKKWNEIYSRLLDARSGVNLSVEIHKICRELEAGK